MDTDKDKAAQDKDNQRRDEEDRRREAGRLQGKPIPAGTTQLQGTAAARSADAQRPAGEDTAHASSVKAAEDRAREKTQQAKAEAKAAESDAHQPDPQIAEIDKEIAVIEQQIAERSVPIDDTRLRNLRQKRARLRDQDAERIRLQDGTRAHGA